ncbi:MAG TPA: IPT/TIG domain-containing protein [Acidobacteriaceae bacterium]|nr:IPT/TIG domain-containing protein [Acidobacteriaceae bacterium]
MSAIRRSLRKPEGAFDMYAVPGIRVRVAMAILFLAAAGLLSGCFPKGGQHNGTGANNQLIDINGEMTVDNQAAGPNLNFTDGTNATLHVVIGNIGDKPSDQAITVTVGPLPGGLTYASYSVTSGNWTCTVSGQTITCTSSDSIPALSSGIHILDIVVKVASTGGANAQLPFSISTPDGQPATFSLPKGVAFAAATPSISSLNPTSGTGGTAVTITGSNFGSSQGSSTITFSGKKATTITSWSATSIVADVPAGTPEGAGPVVVTVNGVASTNNPNFTVTGPQVASLSPASGAIGTAVTITGSNFGSSQGTSTVTFNGTNATTIVSWSSTSIVADVPSLATTGNVVVTVSGIASPTSSSTVFTVTGASGCANGGNAANLLAGDYAFGGQGWTAGTTFTTVVGRFHADGVNTISKGLIEKNSINPATALTAVPFTGCFTLSTPAGASGVALGTLTIANSSASLAMNFSIAIRTSGNGNFITYDTISPKLSGVLEKQCPNAANGTCSAFANSNISGDYGLGFDGFVTGTSNFGVVGRYTAGNSTAGAIDISSYAGVVALNAPLGISGGVTDTTNGVAQLDLNLTYTGGSDSGQAVTLIMDCYLANLSSSGVADAMYCMSAYVASLSPLRPLLSGRFVKQNTPAGGWSTANAAPPSNASVVWSTGVDGAGDARVDVGQFTYNTSANPATLSISQDLNKGGSYAFQTGTENFTVASNGRVQATFSGALDSVCYLFDPGNGVCVNEANNAAFGFFVPQEAVPSGGFTTAALANSFALVTLDPATGGVSDGDGVLTATGAGGSLSGPVNINATSGLSSPSFAGTYSIMSAGDAAIGRYTVMETSPGPDTVILYMVDANTAVALSTASMEPAVLYLKH